MKKLFGFTLSEILVAMAILGIVSTLTIPNVVGNATRKQYAVAFKTTISNLNSGIKLFEADNGYNFAGNRTENNGTVIFRKMLEEKLGAKVVSLQANQQWMGQGIVANSFEVMGNYPTGGISLYASKYFVNSTLGNNNLTTVNAVQNLAFGTNNTNVTHKLSNGAYILTTQNVDNGCNFRSIRWDKDNNEYITPNIYAGGDNDPKTSVCIAFIDVNGAKGPNRITNCMSNSVLVTPISSTTCTNMIGKEVADIYPILFFDSEVIPATSAGNTVLSDSVKD